MNYLGAVLLASLVGLTACAAALQARVVAEGQLFCAKASATGPLVVALANAAGAPVIVTGMTAQSVTANCAIISAIPVSPPVNPADAPVVAVAGVKS